jgi:hypothetical protein
MRELNILINDILNYSKYNLKHPLSKLNTNKLLISYKMSYTNEILNNKEYYNRKLNNEYHYSLETMRKIIEYNKLGKIHPMVYKIHTNSFIKIINHNYDSKENFDIINKVIKSNARNEYYYELNNINDTMYFLNITKALFTGEILQSENNINDYSLSNQDYIEYLELVKKEMNKLKNGDYH